VKEASKRQSELRTVVCPPLVRYLTQHMNDYVYEKYKAVFVATVLQTKAGGEI
jgi:hypothetical protein